MTPSILKKIPKSINLQQWSRTASAISSLPLLDFISPSAARLPSRADQVGFLRSQNLAFAAVKEVAKSIQPGWTEKQAANLINTYLRDHHVDGFFHYAFVWYGERTRFDDVARYSDFAPTDRVLRENEVYILDVAPIVDGYISDIGYTACCGENLQFKKAEQHLQLLRELIPSLFLKYQHGDEIWQEIDRLIKKAGYENIHQKYPMAVLGHRVHRAPTSLLPANLYNFGWQSYWALLSRGLFGQLLNHNFRGSLQGLWAIEPHIGTATFGAKFEEILVVEKDQVRWLNDGQIS